MSNFKPQEALLDALATLKTATKIEIRLLVNPETSAYEKSLNTAFYTCQSAGYIMSKRVNGDRMFELTEKGKAKQQGKDLVLGKIVEKISPSDVDKAIQKHGGIMPKAAATEPTKPANITNNFGITFTNDNKLIIWNGQDEVVFNPPEAIQVIAFVANQLPWVEYCQANAGHK